jgi:hypothetical protein
MKKRYRIFVLALAVPFLYVMNSCGGSSGGSDCTVGTETGCDEGQVCERTTGSDPACYDPVVLKGMVFDLATDAGVEGARVVAKDANGAVASSVAVTDADGNYELDVRTTRDDEGNPAAGESVTLRADAEGYQTFPGGVRQALPVDLTSTANTSASVTKADIVIDNALTDIGLIELEAGAGTGQIFGSVELPEDSLGALVVAELSATEGYTAIADTEGEYRIFNLPAGNYTVNPYVQGANYDAGQTTIAGGDEKELNFNMNDSATADLTGKVNIVNPGQGSATSIILVLKSTFDSMLIRGETPPGLRAPEPGIDPDVTGTFTIEGIPTGTYMILAAFENDFLVRDPDTCISGTAILEQAFSSGQSVDLSNEAFKITGSLDVIQPGADGPEMVTTPNPVLSWEDDSSEDNYDIVVYDTFGNKVWETSIAGTSGSNPTVQYDFDGMATPLESGMYYQFKATSTKGTPACELSQTEDLKGVFYLE